MSRLKQQYETNGFFGIGILNVQEEHNIGTLWRSAYILGASFIFTIDKKYKKQTSDVTKAWTKIPLYHYDSFEDFRANLPYATKLIGVEMTEGAVELAEFDHPARAAYLLGCETSGLSSEIISQCHSTIVLPGHFSLNVAVTGSIVMYDRSAKTQARLPQQAS